MSRDGERDEVTIVLIRRDIDELKHAAEEMTSVQKEILRIQQAQSLACARTCAAAEAARDAMRARCDGLEQRVDRNEKRLNQVFGLNTLITAIGSILAALLGGK